jgi:hypothetical protein
MVHYFKQSCLLMLWALFLVNISFTSCDDKNPEVQIGELTPQKLYQTSWRGTGRCDAWVVPNMGVGMQFIDTQSGKVNWESYDEIDITYKIEGKYIIFNSNALYLGGAAYLVSKAIREAEVVAFADLGMEAIYKFVVKDMPVSVAVDVNGTSIHATAPKIWQAKIGKIPVVDAAAG